MDLASDIGLDGGALKKGPWTSAEDSILISYVTKHGEGNWNSVQKHSGLFRCGKSCRLRWANHLRPNLKKGAFTPEEERTIVELHAKLGNKWARMAAQALSLQVNTSMKVPTRDRFSKKGRAFTSKIVKYLKLPGRTDNEIKNYWNTRIKRRTRAGLPVYPADKAKSSPNQYYVEPSDGRSFISGKDADCDFASSFSQPVAGDHLQNLHVSNGCDNRLLSNWTSMNALPPSSAIHQMGNHLLNKGIGNPFEQAEVIRNSQLGRNAGGNGPVCLAQFSDGRNMNLQPDFNSSSQACDRGTMTRAVFSGFGNEPDRNTMLYDRMSVYGNLNMLYKPQVSIASLKLELPSSQSAESADSAGTQRSSIINPSPIITSNNILSESESYGSNASNFLEALMQEAHPMEGVEQVRLSMDLIDQLMVLSSGNGNVPPDVAALVMSPQKGRWGEDSDPTTPLGGRTFSDHSEEVSPMCQTGNWDEPQASSMHSLPPAPQLVVPRIEDNAREIPRGGTQQACTDEDFLTLLDLANSDSVPEWYTPSEYYSGGAPCVPLVDSMDAVSNHQMVPVLDNPTSNHSVANHVWELGSCTWNPASAGCHLGEFSPVEYRPQASLGDQNVRRATC